MEMEMSEAFDFKKFIEERKRSIESEFERIPAECDASEVLMETCMVPMSDGVRLKTYIFRVPGPDQVPVLFTRSCYPNDFEMDSYKCRAFARRGFACVYQYCRGTGGSEGIWEPNVHERSDGIDAIRWLDAQPWVKNIGYYGSSYLALTGWAWADQAPEKLKGMYLSVYGTDRFVSAYNDGLFRQDILTAWSMQNAGAPVDADFIESCRFMPQAEVDRRLWGVDLPWYREMITNTDYTDDYWQTGFWRTLREIPSKVKVPVVIEEGWYDHHLGSALCGYRSMRGEGLEKCLLRIGPWNHGQACALHGHACHNAECGQITNIYRFFRTLLVEEQAPDAGVSLYLIGEDRWLNEKKWPRPDEIRKFYLNARERTLEDEGGETTFCTYVYDPTNPVPSHGAESCFKTIGAVGSLRQPQPNDRPDVVSFISAPLDEDLTIIGRINADLYVSSDAEDTAFSIKVMEVFENGEAYNIRSGITTLAYRGHSDARQTYAPGTVVKVNIDTWDIAWTAKRHSRIRVDISSSDFPQYNIHSNEAGVWSLQEKCKPARQTIFCGKEYPSVVNVPVRCIEGRRG